MTIPDAGKLVELAAALDKRAKEERQIAENSRVVAELLQPQMALFDQRDGGWNTYAVRLALDHRDSCARDDKFAELLEQAAAALRAQASPAPAIEEKP